MPPIGRFAAAHGALLVVDLQEKILARIPDAGLVVAHAARLVRGARLVGVPTFATEQYPKGLGGTAPALAELLPDRPAKTTFSCLGCAAVLDGLRARSIRHVTLVGIEAHVCVAQTALDLLELGFAVQVAADAVASRRPRDSEVALRRLEGAGAVVTTAEAVLFEWAESADHPNFKAISALVKDFESPTPSTHQP